MHVDFSVQELARFSILNWTIRPDETVATLAVTYNTLQVH